MLRYLLLSTVIVVGIAMGVAAWVNRDLIRIKIASVYARVPPKPSAALSHEGAPAPAMRGDAAVGALGVARMPDTNVGVERVARVRASASAARRGPDCAAGDVGVW